MLEGDRQTMRGGSSKACSSDQSGQGCGPGLERCQNEGGLVEDAYSR